MIYQDNKRDIDNQTALADYLASFWNPEAVKKVQEVRNSAAQHSFQTDDEFEQDLLSGEYKDSPLLDAVIKLRKIEGKDKIIKHENKRAPKSKLPTDLSSIKSTLRKFDKK